MKRSYKTGETENIDFFTGKEVEHTPAYNMDTLFVVGIKSVESIEEKLATSTYETKHIFFGANHSYNPSTSEEYAQWDNLIQTFLDKGYWCSLDIPINHTEVFLEGPLNEYHNFIPQIRVPLPYIGLWNYNTTIKIDDKGFNVTNPGVWSHSLHDLKDRNKFTHWFSYKNDEIIK